jgi:hypothetical protein
MIDNNRFRYSRRPLPVTMVFGWLFLITGIGCTIAGVFYHEPIAVSLGIGFSFVGLVMALGRSGIIIDKRRHEICVWRGILFPLYCRQRAPIHTFKFVVLTREEHGGGVDSETAHYTEYVVSLGNKDALLRVDAFREDFPKARARCEQLAKFLQLPLYDKKEEGKTTIRQVTELDETLAQRARRTQQRMDIPPKPEECVTEYSKENGHVVFLVPPSGFGFLEILLMVFAGAGFIPILAALFLFAFQPNVVGLPRPIYGAVMCLSVIPLWLMRFAFVSATRSERLTVSHTEVHLEYLNRKKKARTIAAIPISEAEELELCKSTQRQGDRVVALRTDRETIEFGGSLQTEEQDWLYAVLRRDIIANQAETSIKKHPK